MTRETSNIAGPHRDYENNLSRAKKFIQSQEGKLPNGMTIKIADSEHINSALLAISFGGERVSNFANNVSLHQSSDAVASQVSECVEKIKEIASKYA